MHSQNDFSLTQASDFNKCYYNRKSELLCMWKHHIHENWYQLDKASAQCNLRFHGRYRLGSTSTHCASSSGLWCLRRERSSCWTPLWISMKRSHTRNCKICKSPYGFVRLQFHFTIAWMAQRYICHYNLNSHRVWSFIQRVCRFKSKLALEGALWNLVQICARGFPKFNCLEPP